jgi:hypothetical protein
MNVKELYHDIFNCQSFFQLLTIFAIVDKICKAKLSCDSSYPPKIKAHIYSAWLPTSRFIQIVC